MTDCVRVCAYMCTLPRSVPHRLPCGCHLASRHQSATLQSPRSCKHGRRGGVEGGGGGGGGGGGLVLKKRGGLEKQRM